MNEQERVFIKQFSNDPGFKIKDDVIDSELSRLLTESNYEVKFNIEHNSHSDSLIELCENIKKHINLPDDKHVAALFENNDIDEIIGWSILDKGNKPITDIIPTEDLENWEKHIKYNIRGTYGSIEHDEDGNKIIKDIKLTGIDINDVKYD